MKNFLSEKLIISTLLFLIIAGVIFRLIFLQDVISKNHLNILFPDDDDYNSYVLALNIDNPDLEINKPVYPAYSYFQHFIFKTISPKPSIVFIIQFLLSLLSTFLIFQIGSLFFGFYPGILASLLLLFYKMNYLYDCLLRHTALIQVLLIATLYFFASSKKNSKFVSFFCFCIFGIILSIFRAFFWPIFISGIIFLFIRQKHWKSIGYLFSYICLTIAAIYLFHCTPFISNYKHQSGFHFYIGNNENSTGLMQPIEDVRNSAHGHATDALKIAYYVSKDQSQLNSFWFSKSFYFIKNHPKKYINLLWKKFLFLINDYEIKNNASIYYYEKKTKLQSLPKLSFSLIFIFAMIGIFYSFKQNNNTIFVLVPFIYLVIMILSVFICSRYRMPIIPFLCISGGLGLYKFGISIYFKKVVPIVFIIFISILLFKLSTQNFDILDKEKDIAFFEAKGKNKVKYLDKKNKSLDLFKKRTLLNKSELVALASELALTHCYKEFFKICKITLPLIQKDEKATINLLFIKAKLYENIFNFNKAIETWNELKHFKQLKQKADFEIKLLEIYSASVNC